MVYNILLLSRRPDLYATKRIYQAAERYDYLKLTVVDPAQFVASINVGSRFAAATSSLAVDTNLNNTAVIPRISSICPEYAIFVLSQLEACGAESIASSDFIWIARNKFLTLKYLLQHCSNIVDPSFVPPSTLLRFDANIDAEVEKLGGYPVVIKFLRGTAGAGVILARDSNTIRANLVALNQLNYDLMLQKYYPEAREHDVRLVVIGPKIVAAVKRVAVAGEFRSNYHQGGKLVAYTPTNEEIELALALAKQFRFEFCAIDLIGTNAGLKLLEINSSPGFEGLESIGVNQIPELLLEFLIAKKEAR